MSIYKYFFYFKARGQKKKVGWFPANYVKLLGGSRSTPDNARSTPDNTLQKPDQLTPTPPAAAAVVSYPTNR